MYTYDVLDYMMYIVLCCRLHDVHRTMLYIQSSTLHEVESDRELYYCRTAGVRAYQNAKEESRPPLSGRRSYCRIRK